MTNVSKNSQTASKPRIRISFKFHRLIFTGLMALLMSFIISSALLLVKEGFSELFFEHLFNSWWLAFVFAWPSAYVCAFLIQKYVLNRIDFY